MSSILKPYHTFWRRLTAGSKPRKHIQTIHHIIQSPHTAALNLRRMLHRSADHSKQKWDSSFHLFLLPQTPRCGLTKADKETSQNWVLNFKQAPVQNVSVSENSLTLQILQDPSLFGRERRVKLDIGAVSCKLLHQMEALGLLVAPSAPPHAGLHHQPATTARLVHWLIRVWFWSGRSSKQSTMYHKCFADTIFPVKTTRLWCCVTMNGDKVGNPIYSNNA